MESNTLTDRLNAKLAVADGAHFEPGQGGLTRIVLRSPHATAHVYQHGGHVTHFQPHGKPPVLWMSQRSAFEAGKPIRGGIPLCFPWFGPRADHPEAPAHGFARTSNLKVRSLERTERGVQLTLVLDWTPRTFDIWPHAFSLVYRIHLTDRLELALTVSNHGQQAMRFEEALHTYFAVGDIHRTTVTGLEGATYIDKMDQLAVKPQGPEPIRFTGETDRVYQDTTSACMIHDEAGARRIEVAKAGSKSTVVWNPWIEKARRMPDFGDDEWPGMLCVETANVAQHAIELQPGDSHTLEATIAC